MWYLLNKFHDFTANILSKTVLYLNFGSSICLFLLEPIDYGAKSHAI